MRLCDSNLAKLFIEKFGFDKKSFLFPKISNFLLESLYPYFMRGYFDGDGHIEKYRISISSTINNNWEEFISICNSIGVVVGKIRKYKHLMKPHQFSQIRLKKHDSHIFLNFIYKSYLTDKIGLDRKYKKFATYYQPN